MKIIGIDPGLVQTGFGIINVKDNQVSLIDYGIIKPAPRDALSNRLLAIFIDVCEILSNYNPQVFAIEDVFYGKNVKSALLLGHSRGIPLLLSAKFKLSLHEFSARRIKQSLTGNGNASKEQVQFMVKKLLLLDQSPNPTDASDALAAAICYNQNFKI